MLTRFLPVVVVYLAAISAAAAFPVQWKVEDGGNGHWYEFVLDWGASWESADTAAQSARYDGLAGHLVTITSQAENDFVRQMATEQYPWSGSTTVHIGAAKDSAGNWIWSGGPEAGVSLSDGFVNWRSGPPDFWADYAMMDLAGKWFGTDGYGAPYVIEYSRGHGYGEVPLPGSVFLLVGALAAGVIAARRRSSG